MGNVCSGVYIIWMVCLLVGVGIECRVGIRMIEKVK